MELSSFERRLLSAVLLAFGLGVVSPNAVAQKPKIIKSKPANPPSQKKADSEDASVEPDKVLFNRASLAIKQRKFTEARLDLQTLINTYPDSEYLAKAKLAIADSYYREGGTSNLTQAIEEYKNFIVFFPFLDEAAYAQQQVAMAHYRMMEKSDRDNSQALQAETEFQIFLQKYPQSKLYPQAEQSLRNVQEVLADGEYRIARFYYLKLDYRASAARLVEVSERYPLYSQSDQTLWMLADVYQRAKEHSKNEDDKNHWSDLEGKCYSRIVTDYPMSKLVPGAKAQLKAMGMPVPTPTPNATARMQKDLAYQKDHHPNSMLDAPLSMFREAPDVRLAAQAGPPNLSPPDDAVSATDVLTPGASGPRFGVASLGGSGGASDQGSSDQGADLGSTGPVITPGAGDGATAGTAVQIIEAPGSGATADQPAGSSTDSSSSSSAGSSSTAASAQPSSAGAPSLSSVPDASGGSTAATPEAATSTPTTPNGQTGSSSAPGTSSGDSQAASASSGSSSTAPQQQGESTSKKKKGLHKVIPF